MVLENGSEKRLCLGMWPEKEGHVCVLKGAAHSFEDMVMVGDCYDEISDEYYDIYQLTNGWKY